MRQQLALQALRLQNFKAIRDSGLLTLTPLTILIGNNGSGKSSLIEGLMTYQMLVTQGLDAAMNYWRGFEQIRNQAVPHALDEKHQRQGGRLREQNPLIFAMRAQPDGSPLLAETTINSSPGGNELFIQAERIKVSGKRVLSRDERGNVVSQQTEIAAHRLPDGDSVLAQSHYQIPTLRTFAQAVAQWQFVMLTPDTMGQPTPQQRTGAQVRLARSGSNIAEYLLDIRKRSPAILDEIIATLHYVLPYAVDLQPVETLELGRSVYLQLTEGEFKIPGWLLSSGTLRVVALLALLRHPVPPPLIVIEELENGLDPRTINLVVQEIRHATQEGRTQVIATTHSPYLLDLLELEQLIVVERVDGSPIFFRPADDAQLQAWAQSFTPGALYTMSQLQRGGKL